MTLRRQFHLLLAAVVIVPFLCVSLAPLYHWTHPAEQTQLNDKQNRGYFKDKNKNKDKSWENRKEKREASGGGQQIEEKRGENHAETGSKKARPQARAKRWHNFLLTKLYIPVCAFIVIILYLVLRLSRTIFSSIQVLEEKTRLIADGDLNVALIDTAASSKVHSNEITSLTHNLERMRQSLSDLKERRTRFIMGISHDLRTPIAVIKGYAEAITDGVVSSPAEVADAALIIGTKSGQLDAMIEELISFVKLDSRDWRKTLEKVPLKKELESFVQDALSTGNVFHRNVTGNIEVKDATVQMDRGMFRRMMENLFGNAIRYSSDGDSIAINAYETDAQCRIEVCDTGMGIAQDELESIFDMFQRGTHSRREEGMGIGLAVVKSVADAHGWDISVKSKLGEGTMFAIVMQKDNN